MYWQDKLASIPIALLSVGCACEEEDSLCSQFLSGAATCRSKRFRDFQADGDRFSEHGNRLGTHEISRHRER